MRNMFSGGLVAGALLFVAVAFAAVTAAGDPKPIAAPDGKYIGREACIRCHWKMSRTWKATAHAQALEDLPARYRDDAACLVCHATGHGRDGGFVSVEKTPEMAGVQCEMCHGPGAAHAEFTMANEKTLDDLAVATKAKSLIRFETGAACIRCHVAQGHGEHPEYTKEPGAYSTAPKAATATAAPAGPRGATGTATPAAGAKAPGAGAK